MNLSPEDITIAITVYDRRQYIKQAIASALNQSMPVKVIVVEDCGPDLTLERFVKDEFGSRIDYFRNPTRRGLFDNWNACIDFCRTRWLSILHDDDFFHPTFVKTMLDLSNTLPSLGLYFGNYVSVNEAGQKNPAGIRADGPIICQTIDLKRLANGNFLGFAGHLFSVENAKEMGGFRPYSLFSGDWEMWFKLTSQFGGGHTNKEVVSSREYDADLRGTSKVMRRGWNYAATNIQLKRNYAYLKNRKMISHIDFDLLRNSSPMSLRYIYQYGYNFSPRMLAYNLKLFRKRRSSSFFQKIFRAPLLFLGPTIFGYCLRTWHFSLRKIHACTKNRKACLKQGESTNLRGNSIR